MSPQSHWLDINTMITSLFRILGTARQAVLVYTFYSYLIIHNVEGAAALLNDVWYVLSYLYLTR